MNEQRPLVEIVNISKNFDPTQPPALDNISATINRGQMVGLAGPDGAGKTTLIRLIAGLLLPTTGSITVDGFDSVKQANHIHTISGYMPQRFGLYEDLTVIQNLNLYAALRNVSDSEKDKTYEKLFHFTTLGPFKDRLAGDLSGGMKQKLGLACALVKSPQLLLLDEPTVGVDPISRRELWEMVKDLLKEGISVIWSTAYLDEAERCDNVLLLNNGSLLYNGSPQSLSKRVEGRTFKLSNFGDNRRAALVNVLRQPDVIDGVLQGSDIRIVVRNPDISQLKKEEIGTNPHVKIEPVKPRFEDAFIDILGGGPGGYSGLAENMPTVTSTEEIKVEAKGLTKLYGTFVAAENITFKIKKGEIFGLLGPNGAGKSTTFKMMCGLLKPTKGEAFVNGLNLQVAPSKARSQIGYMAQKFSLYGDLSVGQNLDFFSGVYNLTGKHRQEAVKRMIQIFDFQHYVDESAGLLPLGFKQRLALSCAVIHDPEIIFLDEPTSGVDPIMRREFWNHINGMVEKGFTVMVTTHFMDEAEYCDRIGLIYRGKMIQSGSPDELKSLAKSAQNPHPSLEDAFIQLIEQYDAANP